MKRVSILIGRPSIGSRGEEKTIPAGIASELVEKGLAEFVEDSSPQTADEDTQELNYQDLQEKSEENGPDKAGDSIS